MYDVGAIRSHIPALDSGIAFFDGPGRLADAGCRPLRAIAEVLTGPLANRRRIEPPPRAVRARSWPPPAAAMADFVGGDPQGIVFGRSMTQLCFDVSRALAKDWGPGDEVAVTPAGPRRPRPALGAGRAGGRRHRAVD